MATTALQYSCAARTPALASGANTAKEFHRTAVRISQTRYWSSHVSNCRLLMSSKYSDKRGGGAGDFVVGVLLAGAAFGALAYILAPQRILNETIAQLNAAIDNVPAQLRATENLSTSSGNNVELEPAA